MYGAVLTEPVTPDGDLGVFFLHNEGYSTMCGHAMVALGTALLDTGLLRRDGDAPEIRLDTPAGRVAVTAQRAGGRVRRVTFRNVPSFVFRAGVTVDVPDRLSSKQREVLLQFGESCTEANHPRIRDIRRVVDEFYSRRTAEKK